MNIRRIANEVYQAMWSRPQCTLPRARNMRQEDIDRIAKAIDDAVQEALNQPVLVSEWQEQQSELTQLREQSRVADQARRHAQAEGTKLVEEKRALARDRERLRDVVEEIKMALLDRYDGAPDSTTRWMGPLLADIDCAQALRHAPRSQKGAV